MSITSLSSKNTILSIPDELLSSLIIPFAGNIDTTQSISKIFQKISEQSSKDLVESYKQHSKLSKIVTEHITEVEKSIKSGFSLTDKDYLQIADLTYQTVAKKALSLKLPIEKISMETHVIGKHQHIVTETVKIDLTSLLENIETREKELNFIAFFKRLSTCLPEDQRPHFKGEPPKQVALMRSWMNKHQTLLDSITELNLSELNLIELPPEIALLTYLEILYLSNNQLTTLPPQIAQLKNLTVLILNENQITSLPEELYELVKLTALCLSDNQIKDLSPKIGKLTSLIRLNLSNNQLGSLPIEIGLLAKLSSLLISKNKLRSLPDAICECTMLELLAASNNQFTALPEKFGQLIRLSWLDLSSDSSYQLLFGNQIEFFPATFNLLQNLTTLNLSGMQLTSVPDIVCDLVNLEVLYLSRNQLRDLPEAFQGLRRLNTLDLSDNQFLILPQENLPLSITRLHYNETEPLPAIIELI